MNDGGAKLKIAFFGEDFSRQAKGTALVVQKLAEQYLDNFSDRIELALIRKAGHSNHPVARKIRNIEIKVYPTPIFSTLISYLVFFLKNREEFDAVIFNRNVYPGFWLLNSKKFILLLHDAPVSQIYKEQLTLENKLFYLFLKYSGKYFLDKIVAVSNDARAGIINYLNLEPDQAAAIYNGAGKEFRQFSPEEKVKARSLLEKKYNIIPPYILAVSRLEPHKNIHALIDAFSILKSQFHLPHKLVIVGGKHLPEYTKMIEAKIANSKFKQAIITAPYIEEFDLPLIYNLADILVFPSLMEGFGLPLVEAMSCGLPIVASDLPVMSEITAGAAILADPRNPQQLANKIFEVLENQRLRNDLIGRGLERSKIFSWQKTAEEMLKLIK